MQVRFLHLQAPASVTPRQHDYLEILYMESGSAVYRVKEREVLVKTGDLFIVGSNLSHGIKQYLSPAIRAVALYFHPRIILGEYRTLDEAEYLIPFEIQGGDFPYGVPAETGIPLQVQDLIHRIHEELSHRTLHSQLAMKTYLKMILVLLMQHYAGNASTNSLVRRKNRNLERLQPVLDYIDRHFAENITVEDAAHILAMSKSHFMRYFRTVTGQAFISYLNRFRVSRAQQLLASSDRNIAAVSQEVGFCDQSYFGVLFRRIVGTTPREYRSACSADPADKTGASM